jgi:hypothetical protein
MEEVGIRVYRMPSSPTTIAIKKVSRWHHLTCYMVVGAKERKVFGPNVLQEVEKQVLIVSENL